MRQWIPKKHLSNQMELYHMEWNSASFQIEGVLETLELFPQLSGRLGGYIMWATLWSGIRGSWFFFMAVGVFLLGIFALQFSLLCWGRTGQKNAEQNTPSLLKWNTNLWNHQHKRPWLPKQGPTRLLDFFKPLLNHVMLIEEHHDHNPALRLIWTHQSPIRNLSALG